MKNIVITQSNYIPWKGYFDAIDIADEFVIYDDMQYTRRDWRNRNMIKTPQGVQWLTIPVEVKGKYFQKINETRVSDKSWNITHWKTIQQNYAKARCFKDYKDFFEDLYTTCNYTFLTEINVHFLQGICKQLGITTNFRFSSDYTLKEEKTERLLDLCIKLGGTTYYSGPAAREYMNEELFKQANIAIQYFDYNGYPEYEQLYPPFVHSVSIIDLMLNEGHNARKFLKNAATQ